MAETIRDVTIRIGIKQDVTVLKAPDVRQFQTAIQKLQEELKAGLREATRFSLEVPDFTAVQTGVSNVTKELEGTTDAVSELEKRFDQMIDDVVEGAKDTADAFVDSRREIENQGQAIGKLKSETVDFNLRAAEGFKTAGDGAFQLARSMAIMTSSDEDLQVIIQRIAGIQAGFDLFRGSVDLIKGTVEGIRALRSASVAAAAAQETLAVATTASGAAATGASVGFTLLNKSMGKIGLIIAGVTLLVGAAAIAYAYFRGEVKQAGEDIPDDINKITEAQKKLNEELKKRQEVDQWFLDNKTGKNELQVKIDELKVTRDQLTIQQQIAQIDARKAKNFGFKSVEKLKEDAEGFRLGEFDPEAGLSSAKELSAVIKIQMEAEREKLSLIQQQSTIKDKSLQQAKSELEVLKDTLAKEEGRKQTLQERVGRLDPKQLLAFKQLSKKAGEGNKLSGEELSKLESLGGSGVSQFTGKQFAEIGQQRGAVDLFNPFGSNVNKDISETKGQIGDKNNEIEDLTKEVEAAFEKKREQEKESADIIAEFLIKEAGAKGQIEYLAQRLAERDGAGD